MNESFLDQQGSQASLLAPPYKNAGTLIQSAPMHQRTLHRNQRRALPLNTNNIALHEEAIKAFEENEESSCTTHSRRLEQHRHQAKAKANQNIAANNWTIEKRRLDALEATATKQLNDVLQRLDLSPSQLLDADVVHTDHPSTKILRQVDSILQHRYQPDQDEVGLTPAMVASCLIQARDEVEAIGEELQKACKIASAQARKAQLQVTQALRADLNSAEFPPQLKAKLDVLKKVTCSAGNDDSDNDGTGSESAFIELEATIIERLAKAQAKYDDQISNGKNLDEATIAFHREMQQASRWAIRQVDDAIARESNRREAATLASIRKELKEECSHRLAELREARQKAALIAMNEEQERRLVQEKKEEEHAAQREKERTETNAALEQWRETQRQEEERQRVEDSARKYQEELDRIERIKANGERVSYRETRLLNKMDEKRKALTEAARAEELKYERLSQLAATVPYWDNILEVHANIHGTTVARENGAYHEDVSGLTAFQHGLSKLQSFTNEKVFSDRRFRLGHALHEAGISQTAAARDAVARAAPRERNPICDHSV